MAMRSNSKGKEKNDHLEKGLKKNKTEKVEKKSIFAVKMPSPKDPKHNFKDCS